MDQSHEEAGPDPLGEAFTEAKTQEGMLNYGEWAVSYGSYGTLKIPKTELAPSTTGWLFWKENLTTVDAATNLAEWFEAMAHLLKGKASKPASGTPPPPAVERKEPLDPKIAAMIARARARRALL
jgi:hypothetical protein